MNNFLRVGFLPYFITAKLTKNSVVNKTTLFLFILLGQLLYHCQTISIIGATMFNIVVTMLNIVFTRTGFVAIVSTQRLNMC